MRYTVQIRTDEGWTESFTPYSNKQDAIVLARRLVQGYPEIDATRVWEAGPSWTGDKMIWDSRDAR
jgi:hypothetical protein